MGSPYGVSAALSMPLCWRTLTRWRPRLAGIVSSNAEGRRRGIDPVSLFMGPARRAEKWASEELLEWWRSHPRMTYQAFERRWLIERQEWLDSESNGEEWSA